MYYIYTIQRVIYINKTKKTIIYKVILITQITQWGLLLYINHCLIKSILLKSQSVDGEYLLFSNICHPAVALGGSGATVSCQMATA